MERYICIHGHFYQPPRENPWLEDVELQDSAYPHHDWNQRITEECYHPNSVSRILGSDKKIVNITNNYKKISFNFGPTLMSWLQRHSPETYDKIKEADKKSQDLFSGHGSAIAQCYGHMIMPLTDRKDKQTQVIWGIKDFKDHFQRDPEGMWLPETAVDTESLEALAENGIKFTILAPYQAKKFRKINHSKWTNNNGSLNTTRPYLCRLPSGKTISIFFYNGSVSHDIAYGGLLHSGDMLAARMTEIFDDKDDSPQLAHIATDGETYGHHHKNGEMALSYCLQHIENHNLAKITVYGEFLEKFPPQYEVEIAEETSWSCAHGVGRWKENCGCCAGRFPCGQQQYREPLRQSLDWLRDSIRPIYEEKISEFGVDPWQLRNNYITLIKDRSSATVEQFLKENFQRDLRNEEIILILKLLEAQRNAMLMYTSCGWFFDNISGIETVQVLMYAARTIQLMDEIDGNFEEPFKEILAKAPENHVAMFENGKDVYEKLVQTARIDLHRVGAHLAVSSLFEEPSPNFSDIFCYTAVTEDYDRIEAGIQALATGRTTIKSNITLETYQVDFAVLYFGEHNITAAVAGRMDDEKFHKMRTNIRKAFTHGDTTEVMRIMNLEFEGRNFSLWHLFKDEQRRIVNQLLGSTWQEIAASFEHIYQHNYTIMQMMRGMNIPLPKPLASTAEYILNESISDEIESEKSDIGKLKKYTEEVTRFSLTIDSKKLNFETGRKIARLMDKFQDRPEDVELLGDIIAFIQTMSNLVSDMNLEKAQNIYFVLLKSTWPRFKDQQDDFAKNWKNLFQNLGGKLGIKIPES